MNMKLIDPSDPLYFQQTSDGPYDRHHYRLVYNTGKTEYYESWETMFAKWFQSPALVLSHVEVLDIKPKNKGKGFS